MKRLRTTVFSLRNTFEEFERQKKAASVLAVKAAEGDKENQVSDLEMIEIKIVEGMGSTSPRSPIWSGRLRLSRKLKQL